MSNLLLSDVFFQALNTPKLVFGRGSPRTPLGMGVFRGAPIAQEIFAPFKYR